MRRSLIQLLEIRLKRLMALMTVAVALGVGAVTQAGSYDADDFIVASFLGNSIAIFDHDFTFKSFLDDDFGMPTGLGFDADGILHAASLAQEVRQYQPNGNAVGSFTSGDLGMPFDIKVANSGHLFVGTETNLSVREFSDTGQSLRTYGGNSYGSVALLGSDVLWAGGSSNPAEIDVFDISSGSQTGTIPLDNGQFNAKTMFYASEIDAVLMTDSPDGPDSVFERSRDGALVREFATANDLVESAGITRGPNGDVFVTDFSLNSVFRWQADGTFIGEVPLTNVSGATQIVWAGNVIPEPPGLLLSALAACVPIVRRSRIRRTGDLQKVPPI